MKTDKGVHAGAVFSKRELQDESRGASAGTPSKLRPMMP
jgi:hypothetical protein